MDHSTDPRAKAFEARLRALREQATRGLSQRAAEMRNCVQELSCNAPTLDALERHLHRLHGIAGTHGHQQLSEIAARLEGQLRSQPLADTMKQTLELVALMEQTAREVRPDEGATPQTLPATETTGAAEDP